MKDELIRLLSGKEGYNAKLNTMREYLQAFILRILFRNDFFQHAAFLGGTCLRFVYNIKRFSEDLDFSLQNPEAFEFENIIHVLINELKDSGYNTQVKIKKDGVYSAMNKFSGLLFEAGMSQRKEENFSIKIEVDMRPPGGAQTETQLIDKYFMSGVTCFNLPTLFAGKINAVLTRDYVKGRDYYDLFWYLTRHKNLQPNIEFLKNALGQFGQFEEHGSEEAPGIENWKSRVIEKVTSVDWGKIQKEMELLIEDKEELKLFNKENFLLFLKRQ
jgi:predicted nucleotidyltransferase component of viral defense system